MEIVNQPKTNILSHLSIAKEKHCDNNSHQWEACKWDSLQSSRPWRCSCLLWNRNWIMLLL